MSAEIKSIDELKDKLVKLEPRFAEASAGRLDPAKVRQQVLFAVGENPYLLRCDGASLLLAALQLTAVGLEIGRVKGEAALVPRKGKVQAMPMTRGLVTLAKRSGDLIAITPLLVYTEDVFDVEYGTEPRIIHKPKLDSTKRTDADVRYAYSVSQHRDGVRDFEVMTLAELNEVKRSAEGTDKPTSPWNTWYDEMCRKSVLKRHTKRMDMSEEYRAAVELDNRAELAKATGFSTIIDKLESVTQAIAEQTAERTAALKARMEQRSVGAGPAQPVEVRQAQADAIAAQERRGVSR